MKFMELYQDKIMGAISGLDRIRFRGTLRWLASERGLGTFMHQANLLLKDFGGWVNEKTAAIRESCAARAVELGIEMRYLTRSGVNKEALARQIAQEKNITQGSICMFSVVEPCISPMVKGNRAAKKLEIVMAPRKCVWLYHYFNDERLGFGHVRVQSWLPFNSFICLNGRHWLERQMQHKGIRSMKDENCFPWISDLAAAQRLMDEQLATDWPQELNRLTLTTCPILPEVIRPLRPEYYWSAEETEFATDVMFRSSRELDALYPQLIHHAMRISDSAAVMRYLGRRQPKGRAAEEVLSDYRRRYEGVRVKHWINNNSVKMYNKSGSILRIETTINTPRDFKVFRHPEDDANRPASWQKMRKGVSDLHRRCEVSRQSNERYADSLATMEVKEKLEEIVGDVCHRIRKDKHGYRGLNPWSQEDYRMLTFLARGEHAINGFRNQDLRQWLYPQSMSSSDASSKKRDAGRTTRRLKLLRVHGLIRKVPKVNRYVLTDKGRKFSTAILTVSALDMKELTKLVA